MIKVSIIVPVYNVEKYLQKCLESLSVQTLKEIEIICLNDGSSDNSLNILKKFEANDSRFKVIDKANSGYGHTMNLGLSMARGEYIGIVESDDFVIPEMFEILYTKSIQTNSDIVKSDFFLYWSFPEKVILAKSLRGNEEKPLDIPPSIWTGLYRRKFIEDNEINFLETLGASFQDTSFNYKVWSRAKKVSFVHQGTVFYRQDNMNSSVKNEGKVFEIKKEFDEIERFLAFKDSTFMRRKVLAYIWNYQRLGPIGKKEFFPILRETCLETQKNLLNINLPLKYVLMTWLVARAPKLFEKIVKINGR